uniref:Ig-like domain-containing protein n=1 Tax=Neogobius melanostomus TaxID=47308 RepID=A0A8C6WLS8_9GOBI
MVTSLTSPAFWWVIISAASELTPPTPPELSTSGAVSLFCLVYGFYPPNIILHWEKNGARIPSSGQTDAPLWKDQDGGTYLTSSRLNITYAADGESAYSCVVRHESSEAPYRSTIKDVFGKSIPSMYELNEVFRTIYLFLVFSIKLFSESISESDFLC